MTKKISGIVALLATLCAATAIDAQSMFRGDRDALRYVCGTGADGNSIA